jgi:hypothetical protein
MFNGRKEKKKGNKEKEKRKGEGRTKGNTKLKRLH